VNTRCEHGVQNYTHTENIIYITLVFMGP